MTAVRAVTYRQLFLLFSEHTHDAQAGRPAAGEYPCRNEGFGTRGTKEAQGEPYGEKEEQTT